MSRNGTGPSPQGVEQAPSLVGAAYWLVALLRAVPAIAVGLTITFLEDHSPRVGLIAFGAFALATGVVILVSALRLLGERVLRGIFVAQGTIAAASGIAAMALWNSGIGVLLLTVTVFTALTGVLELYAGLRARGLAPARDWLTVGAFTAVAAIVFVLIPPDPILATGLIGAYCVMVGVFLLIAGFSLKWAVAESGESPEEGKVPQ